MRFSVFALLAVLTLTPVLQERPEPPKGWFCSNAPNAPKNHKCDCHRECVKPSPDSDAPATVVEDPKCKVYCHKEHCACPIKCGPTT